MASKQQPFSSFNFPVVKKVLLAASLVAGLAYFSSTSAFAATGDSCPYPIHASDDLMETKDHGTSSLPVQDKLRWNVDRTLADRISNFNRHYAEYAGYFKKETSFFDEVDPTKPNEFYDSVTGKLLFTAPLGRSFDEWKQESLKHGWPSFRDNEVNWENVRAVNKNEMVSVTGTHLGHNIPDSKGNRYCINLVSIAGYPTENAPKTDK
eukprot:scaffold8804_cov161-Ochromonas_danica.AAC.3